MGETEGLIRARYAVSVLRVAKGSPVKDALRLVEGLSREFLVMKSDGEIAEARTHFLHACQQLAAALHAGVTVQSAWDGATAAASAWLGLEAK
jgi:hypothetical protein